jgi:endonuclease/exonuclease/phosphatase family metal-dependent hydrolase
MDFFYDGGKQVRPEEQLYKKYISGIRETLESFRGADFILVQELDQYARRSHYDDQREILRSIFEYPGYAPGSFTTNYDVFFVPLPLFQPMGRVKSGMALFSLNTPVSSQRYALESSYSWPMGVFMLDRCFILNRYQWSDQAELIVINTHNSAFDDGNLRQAQMEQLREVMLQEYEKGNYVIAGGDWNLNPPLYRKYKINNGDAAHYIKPGMSSDFFPEGWFWVFDSETPTNRFLLEPYLKSRTPTTVIDFFIISPNIRYVEIDTKDLGFENSDHNPVLMKVILQGLEKDISGQEQPGSNAIGK